MDEDLTLDAAVEAAPDQPAAPDQTLRDALSSALEPSAPAPEAAASAPATPDPTDAPPERVAKSLGAQWAQLPPEVKTALRDYESHVGRLASKYGNAAKGWEDIQRTLAPYQSLIQQAGGDPTRVVGNMLETARILSQGTPDQRLYALHQIVQAYKIPVEVGQDGVARLVPPKSAPEDIHRMIHLERQDLTHRAESTHTATQALQEEIETFLADTANAYVREPGFLDTMASLVKAGRAADLRDAYDQAAWLHPATRTLEIAKANQATAGKKTQQAAAAVAASVSPSSNSAGTPTPDPSKMTLRETLAAALSGDLT